MAKANLRGTDGPFATFTGARDRIREIRKADKLEETAVVWVRGGRYEINVPLAFGPEDTTGPVTFAAYDGEEVVVDGGRRITDWRVEDVNDKMAWVADLPEVATGEWYFRQLFVNGQRRPRTRRPKEGFYRIKDVPGVPVTTLYSPEGNRIFRAAPDDIQLWQNLTDVELVICHWWMDEHSPIKAFDPETRLVTMRLKSRAPLVDAYNKMYARYYVENVFEDLEQPGQWYLDRLNGKLYYLPMPEEEPQSTEIYAPCLRQLLRLVGDPDNDRFVESIHFKDITFRHADWDHPDAEFASDIQAAVNVPGAIYMEGARHCVIDNCRIEHIGDYAVELADACMGIRLVGNEIADIGGGGVKLNGSDKDGPRHRRTGDNHITDNHIHACGLVFHAGVGVLALHTFGNVISHNHIHDLFYTGISCGWQWSYEENVARDNRIEKNLIHDIGQGVIDDMGCIYMLGVQPGTVIRGNIVHNANSPGKTCGIYLDEGSSHILVENNISYACSYPFHQHYGRENIIRNNIFAFGDEAILAQGKADMQHRGFTFQHNIVITDGKPILMRHYASSLEQRNYESDLNLFWDVGGRPLTFKGGTFEKPKMVDFEYWKSLGHDHHSIIADPKCRNLKEYDFILAKDSPAFELGFQAFDTSDVGPAPSTDETGRRSKKMTRAKVRSF